MRRDTEVGKVLIDPFRSLSRLKQLVIGKQTREDHPQVMNTAIRLFADAVNSRTKQENGFDLTEYDERTLAFSGKYKEKILAVDVNLSLDNMLDETWRLLSDNFSKDEVGIREDLVNKYWPAHKL